MLSEVTATRYITPLREGGSVPGLVEADDLGVYVAKFTGAAQGRKALVAEVIAGELARRLDLAMPDLVRLEFDPVIALGEPDEEVQDLLKASGGLNLGMDYLPGSVGFDPLAFDVDPALAGRIVWFDALINNVDRSWRNPNLLIWHGDLWLIDHGAALIWHHNWPGAQTSAARPYNATEHALARFATEETVAAAAAALTPRVTPELIAGAVALVPDEWLAGEPGFGAPGEVRDAYLAALTARAAGIGGRITLAGAPHRVAEPPQWLRPWVEGKAK